MGADLHPDRDHEPLIARLSTWLRAEGWLAAAWTAGNCARTVHLQASGGSPAEGNRFHP
jgi:hypothetical protein